MSNWQRVFTIAAIICSVVIFSALLAMDSKANPLTTLEYRIVGLQLVPVRETLAIPKNIAGRIAINLVAGDDQQTSSDNTLGVDGIIEATLRGPSFSARKIFGLPNSDLQLPPLNLVGEYSLDDIKLIDEDSGEVLLEATPSSIPVTVFEEVLVSRVTSKPLTGAEIEEKGIFIDESNFRAVEFEVGFVVDGETIPIKFPVIAPRFSQSTEIIPQAEVDELLAEAEAINQGLGIGVELPDRLAVTGLDIEIKGINLQLVDPTTERDLALRIPPIPALMVIPGKIGLLNQFFSVMLFTENGAPAGSGLSVHEIQASLKLPPGGDQILTPIEASFIDPGDDPLRFARQGVNQVVNAEQEVVNPGFDQIIGTADDAGRLQPGEAGQAEFLVEGLREGLHLMSLELKAKLDGLGTASIDITGKATGSVLVRNPNFSLAFSHPRTVRAGEPYNISVTVLNTSNAPANLLSITLPAASISGAQFLNTDDDGTVDLGNIAPGETATAEFQMRALRTGSVTFSQLTSDSDIVGRFRLRTGVDERGVALSPDSIGYPEYVEEIAERFPGLFAAADRLLGQALSITTAPRLPLGVTRVARGVMNARVLELAEAGQRLRYGDEARRVLLDLILDWQGGRRASDGFDQLLRETNAGLEWRTAVLAAIQALGGETPAMLLSLAAGDFAGRSERWQLLAHDNPQLSAFARSDDSNREASTTHSLSQVVATAAYPADAGGLLISRDISTQLSYGWRAEIDSVPSTVSLLQVDDDGGGELFSWGLPAMSEGDCVIAQADGELALLTACLPTAQSTLISPSRALINEFSPSLVAAVQDIDVNVGRPRKVCIGPTNYRNYGNVLAVLFSKPMTQSDVGVAGAYQLDDGNSATSVQIQPGGRVALLNFEVPFGALIPRNVVVGDVKDRRGNTLNGNALAVTATATEGASIRGRVALANGQPAANVPVTVTMYDAEATAFDCNAYTVRNAQVFSEADGSFNIDFMLAGIPYSVSATNTVGLPTDAVDIIVQSANDSTIEREKLLELASQPSVQDTLLEAFLVGALPAAVALAEGLDRALLRDEIKEDSARIGTEVPVVLRFRGRGSVTGTVIDANGNPVNEAAVNLFPDPNSRELGRGVLTDSSGRFSFFGVPLGAFTVDATAPNGNSRITSDVLIDADSTVDIDISLSEIVAPKTILRGRVLNADAISGHAGARVFVGRYINGRFQNIVAAATAGPEGFWETNAVPQGIWDIVSVAFDGRTKGERRNIGSSTDSPTNVNVVLQGRTTVTGLVTFANGDAVPHALVAGGDMISTADENGVFSLTGVPTGRSEISAGIKANPAAGIAFTRLGSVSAEIIPGVDNYVVVRLEPRGRIVGRVIDAAGQAVGGINVAAPLPDGSGFLWTTANDDGEYNFSNLPLRQYVVSAPAPPVEDTDVGSLIDIIAGASSGEDDILAAIGEAFAIFTGVNNPLLNGEGENFNPLTWGFTRTALTFDGQTAFADIKYLREGTVQGSVINGQGVPIGARVRLTGTGPDSTGAPTLVIRGERNSDPALGTFEFPGQALVGDWGIQVASPFYGSVLSTSGRTTQDQPDVNDLVMRFPPTQEVNGRLAGQVLGVDGQPVGAGVKVEISFGDLEIITNAEGRFDTQIDLPAINDRGDRVSYTVVATNAENLTGRSIATLTPGQTTEISIRLLDLGGVVITVVDAGGEIVEGATVDLRGGDFPFTEVTGVTNAMGESAFNTLFAGRYAIDARVPSGPTTICARGRVVIVPGSTQSITVTLAPTGSITGIFVDSDGTTPIPAAQISVGNLGFAASDNAGKFRIDGIPLGNYQISAVDPVNGRVARINAQVNFAGEIVNTILRVLPVAELRGKVIDGYGNALVPGASVTANFSDGITPTRTVTTDNSGYYTLPGAPSGLVNLSAVDPLDSSQKGFASTTIPEGVMVFNLDISLRSLANIEVQVYLPDGETPAVNTSVTARSSAGSPGGISADTDGSGKVRFSGLPLGPLSLTARSTTFNETRSVAAAQLDLTASGDAPGVELTLAGVGSVSGQLFQSDGSTPLQGREVRLEIDIPDNSAIETMLTAQDGRFSFANIPLGSFRLTAKDGALVANVSAEIAAAEQAVEQDLILSPSGSVTGILLRADGSPAEGVDVVLDFQAPSGALGKSVSSTDASGAFIHTAVPVGNFKLEAIAILFSGIVSGEFELLNDVVTFDLGALRLDELDPFVETSNPQADAQEVPIDTVIEIGFNESIDLSTIDQSGIYLRDGDTRIPAALALVAGDNGSQSVVELTPTQPLLSEHHYEAVVIAGEIFSAVGGVIATGPRDLAGRSLSVPVFIPFRTRDDDPPGVLSVTPDLDAEQIATEGVIRISFDEPVSPEGLVIAVADQFGNQVMGSTSVGVDGLVAVFTPSTNFLPNLSYSVAITGVADLAGNAYEGEPLATNFSTLDTLGPTIAELRIKDGVAPVAGSTIEIEAVLQTAESDVSFRLTEDLISVAQSAPNVLTLGYLVPETGSKNLRGIAIDRFGNEGPTSPVLTINVLENQPPQVFLTQISPATGPVFSGDEIQVLLTATDDVAVTDLRGAAAGGCTVPLTSSGGESILFSCEVPATTGANAATTFIGEARDGSGLSSGELQLVVAIADGTPPAVQITEPIAETEVSAGADLNIIVAGADNFGVIRAEINLSGAVELSDTRTLNGATEFTTTFTVPIPASLNDGETIQITAQAFDAAGLSSEQTINVRTADQIGPLLVSLEPGENATDLNILPGIVATFNEPVELASVNEDTFMIASTDGQIVPAMVAINAEETSLSVLPSYPLSPQREYQIIVNPPLTDKAGNNIRQADNMPFEGLTSAFSTGSLNLFATTEDTIFQTDEPAALQLVGSVVPEVDSAAYYLDGVLVGLAGASAATTVFPSDTARRGGDSYADWVTEFVPGINGDKSPLAAINSPDTVSQNLIYAENFEGTVGEEWSSKVTDGVAATTRFLGRFGSSAETSLSVPTVVGETYTLSFDVWALDSLDNVAPAGPDRLLVNINGVLRYDEVMYDLEETLGHVGFNPLYQDGVIRNQQITFTAESGSSQIRFYSSGLQPVVDESWGLDNVRITTGQSVNLAGGKIEVAFIDNMATNDVGADIRLYVDTTPAVLPSVFVETDGGDFIEATFVTGNANYLDFSLPESMTETATVRVVDNNSDAFGLVLNAVEALHSDLEENVVVAGATAAIGEFLSYPVEARRYRLLGIEEGDDDDDDGIPNEDEIHLGLNPTVSDVGRNDDDDELDNVAEYIAGTDPFNGDTDGDGIPDHLDPEPTGQNFAPVAGPDVGALLIFDGVNDQVIVNDSDELSLTNAVTVEAWVQVNNPQESPHFVMRASTDLRETYKLGVNDNRAEFRVNNSTFVVGNEALMPGQWYHLAGTYDGNTLRIFVDGIEQGALTYSAALESSPGGYMIFGADTDIDSNNQHLHGALDEIRVWNIAKASSAIAANRFDRLLGDEAGLVGYWAFDEGAGLAANDITTNDNNGILGNGNTEQEPIWRPVDRIAEVDTSVHNSNRSSLAFDGNDGIIINNGASLNLGNAFTIEAWVNYASSSDGGVIVNKDTALAININPDGGIKWAIANAQPGNWIWRETGITIEADTWAHLALSFDGTKVRTYVNGILRATDSYVATVPATTTGFRIGSRELFDEQFFAGSIDEVRLWRVVRSAQEIAANVFNAVPPDTTSLAAQWRFESAVGDVVLDAGPNALLGTLGLGATQTQPLWSRDVPLLIDGGLAIATTEAGNAQTNITLPGLDLNGDNLTARIVSLPQHGSLFQTIDGTTPGELIAVGNSAVLNSNRVVIYQSAPGYLGRDQFTYLLGDQFSQSKPRTLAVYSTSDDSDADTLRDIEEIFDYRTDPFTPDTDNDGADDSTEISVLNTNPLHPDSDADGAQDAIDGKPLEKNISPVTGLPPLANALKFDGVDDYAEVPHTPTLPSAAGSEMTLSAWIKILGPSEGVTNHAPIISKGIDNNWEYSFGIVDDTRLRFGLFNCAGNVIENIEGGNLDMARWYHVAVTYTRDKDLVLYLDGEEIARQSASGISGCAGSRPLRIGGAEWPNYRKFNGVITDVRIWLQARRGSEIIARHDKVSRYENTTSAPDIGHSGVHHYYRFDESSGEMIVNDGYLGVDGILGLGGSAPERVSVQIVSNEIGSDQPIELTGRDSNGDLIQAIVTATPLNGRLFQTSDGFSAGAEITQNNTPVTHPARIVIYRADPGFAGRDQFSYAIADDIDTSGDSTLTVVSTGADTDSDGLADIDELNTFGTDPTNPDSDNDGLNDGEEINVTNSDPLNPDTDGDGQLDGADSKPLEANLRPVAGAFDSSPALLFDGRDDYVEINQDLSLHATGNRTMTIEAWVKVISLGTDAHHQTRAPIVAKGLAGEWEYGLYVNDPDQSVSFNLWQCSGSNWAIAAPTSDRGRFELNEWFHVAASVRLGGEVRIYLNGVLAGAVPAPIDAAVCDGTQPVRIGSRLDGQFLNAEIDEVKIWDIERSPEDLAASVGNSRYARSILGGQPQAYYAFNELSANRAIDNGVRRRDGEYLGSTNLVANHTLTNSSAATFDGLSSYVQLPGTWGGESELTIEALVRTSSAFGNFLSVLNTPNSLEYAHLQLGAAGNNVAYTDAGVSLLPIAPSDPTGIWKHLVMSIRSGQSRLYLDGEMLGENLLNFTSINPTADLTIGGKHFSRWFDGEIDELAIYERALSIDEVAMHYRELHQLSFVEEDFSSAELNLALWEIDLSGNMSVSQNDGELHLEGNASSSHEQVEIKSTFRLLGDFDISFDYEWLEYFGPGRTNAQLWVASEASGIALGINHFRSAENFEGLVFEAYEGSTRLALIGAANDLVSDSGSLRMSRTGDEFKAYYRSSGSQDWIEIGTYSIAVSNLQARFLGNSDGVAVRQRWDNLHVQASSLSTVEEHPAGLVGYWRFNEGTGLVANNAAGGVPAFLAQGASEPEWVVRPGPAPTSLGVVTESNKPTALTLPASDPNHDVITRQITALPLGGSVYQTSDGSTLGTEITTTGELINSDQLIYIANGDTEQDAFSYQVSDGQYSSNVATIKLNNGNFSGRLIQPDSATASSNAGPTYRIENAIEHFGFSVDQSPNGASYSTYIAPFDKHVSYTNGNHWTTAFGRTIGESAVFSFDVPVDLARFYLWNHRSNIIAANSFYEVTRYDLVLRDGEDNVIAEFLNVEAIPNKADAQTLTLGAGVTNVSKVEFIIRETENGNVSPYTGIAEVAFETLNSP